MTINETGNFLHICDLSNKAPLIEGLHGTGKSEIIRQYAAEHDLHCETLILSLMIEKKRILSAISQTQTAHLESLVTLPTPCQK